MVYVNTCQPFYIILSISWRQVMTNCQLALFGAGDTIASPTKNGNIVTSPSSTSDTKQLVKRIIHYIRCLPG